MEDQKGAGTEQDSIVSAIHLNGNSVLTSLTQKPVSSLRSLFENKSGVASGSTASSILLTTKSPVRFDYAQGDTQTSTRASLDIPRVPSPWSVTEPIPVTQRLGASGPAVPRPRQLGGRALQRPLSTTSLSAPQSPPRVVVDSPKSPAKPRSSANMHHPSPSAALRPVSPTSVGPHSPRVSPVPPDRLSRLPTNDPQLPIGGAKPSVRESWSSHAIRNDVPVQSASRNAPPLVNRADKPKIPTKPVAIASKVNLEPLIPAADERVSPFNTPPSSDEGVGSETPVKWPPIQAKPPRVVVETSRAHPHSSYRSTQDGNRDLDPVPTRKSHSSDPRDFGFTKITRPQDINAEDRPGLPPRRVLDQRVKADRQVDESNAFHFVGHGRPPRHGPPISGAKLSQVTVKPVSDFLPPPKRILTSHTSSKAESQRKSSPRMDSHTDESHLQPGTDNALNLDLESASLATPADDYPDASHINRRPPYCKDGMQEIDSIYDARVAEICGQYVATTGHVTKVWDLISGETVLAIGHTEKEIRVTSMAFKPGGKASEEGSRLWLGTNYGELQEVDISTQSILKVKTSAHERREIVRIHRHQSSMWTLDDGGRLCVWLGDDTGLPDLHREPMYQRVPKGHTFSIVVQDTLWLASGKEIKIFRPSAGESASFSVSKDPINQPGAGNITSGAIIGGQLDRVYFGHADGKITIYSTENYACLGVISVSVYKISALAGAGFHLWAGYSTGMIDVYDTRTRPWTTRKEWLAHDKPIVNILVDRSSLWKDGVLRVMSLGADNALRLWDGTLEHDWLSNDMQDRDTEYCTFREITALVVTWNAGAATPTHLRQEESDPRFFQDLLSAGAPPDMLVFGFQELVDLEDKTLTAKTLFKGSKKKDPQEQEHMSRQYRAWRDYLVRCLEDVMPAEEPYHLLHTSSMVGLFSCVFIKASQSSRIRNVNAAEIKRGMGGLHGNKGALILRFVIDDSSVCLVNCHLAAGQTQTVHRNNDLTAILESTVLPADQSPKANRDTYVGGGDGSMILDNEICILNGDLNYRIDTMGRDTVVKAISANNFAKLLERDQLLVSRRRNPAFRVRAFKECPVTFAPTYKYDVGSDRYDTSDKRRAPAWCDRILYRGTRKVKQVDYRRHELRVSDHRPVSGLFKMRIKTVSAEKRTRVKKDSEQRFQKAKERLATEAKIQYLRDVLGVSPTEAKRLL